MGLTAMGPVAPFWFIYIFIFNLLMGVQLIFKIFTDCAP
jgi:hypothetical protein